MGNLAQELYLKYFGTDVDTLAICLPKAVEIREMPIVESYKKELWKFAESLKKYVVTREVDSYLSSECYSRHIHFIPNEEPAKGKRRAPPNKNSVVSGGSSKSVNESRIKKEKISDVLCTPHPVVKVEGAEMAAPSWIPPKKKLKEPKTEPAPRVTRSKARKGAKKDSDIIVQDIPIPTYDLSSPQTEKENRQKESSIAETTISTMKSSTTEFESDSETRCTRSKARNGTKNAETIRANKTLQKTRMADNSENVQPKNLETIETSKRSRSPTKHAQGNESKKVRQYSVLESSGESMSNTLYEDAQTTQDLPQLPQPTLNTTYVAAAAESSVLPSLNSTFCMTSVAANDMDKESKKVKTPPKKPGAEIFSPYEVSTTKKKVKAFEKLALNSDIPVKIGSTKPGSAIKSKEVFGSPLTRPKFAPTACSTGTNSRKQYNASGNGSMSAQKDPRERMRKQLEREQAYKKKEALLQQQAESKRKLNEERHMKAQQQREAEKLKQLEALKQKDEKIKQREREREEKLQKQKEEIENKRQWHKKKMELMQNHREQAKEKPIYMTTKAPPLPTEECYDSDDDDFVKTAPPDWCKENNAKTMQIVMMAAGEKIKNTLFCRHAQTPDLKEVFHNIDPTRLKRNSSMHWKKPPRYTMMPNLDETKFTDDEDSDVCN